MIYNTEDLLESIKRRSLVPTSQQTFTDSDLIALVNEEMELSLLPDLLSVREDMFLKSQTVSLVASVSRYSLPERAAGNTLKKVFYVDALGNRYQLSRTDISSLLDNEVAGSEPQRYILKGDEIQVLPTPSSGITGSLEIWYPMRPSEIVATTSCAKITAVSTVGGTTTFTVDTDLTSSLSVGSEIDIINAQSPFHLWGESVPLTGITTSTISVAASNIDNEAGTVMPGIGDYICLEMTSNIPMIPQEFHPLLAQMVAARLMEALGDIQKLQAVNAKLLEMRRQAFQMVGNRVESDSLHVKKRFGILSHLG